MKKIKRAVFFDAGGTLFRPHPSVGEIYSRVAARYGARVAPRELEKRFRTAWSRHQHPGRGSTGREERAWWRSLVEDVFGLGTIPEFEKFFDELYDTFARPESWRLFPDTHATLDALSARGLIIGVVSNWDSRLFRLCEGLGVTPRVRFILASAVVGVSKPHPEIFHKALALAGVAPGEALHVGDNMEEDVEGARAAGMTPVLFDPVSTGQNGVARIRELKEILKLL